MLTVKLDTGAFSKILFASESPLSISEIWGQIQQTNTISKDNFYIIYNGRLANNTDILSAGSAVITPRLFGGKGGFGSMLRAIGAQIEKTTNREACRDLSGRRLRDINEEKRLKVWLEKQSKRQDDASERKKRKLEKLCSEPKHEFKDQKYDSERSILTERVADAVEEGFKAAATTSAVKRVSETAPTNAKKKKVTLGFGIDLDSDELDSSDDDSSESLNDKNLDKKEDIDSGASCSNDATVSAKSESVDNSEKSLSSEKCSEDSSENLVAGKDEVKDVNECKDEPNSNKVDIVEKIKLSVSN